MNKEEVFKRLTKLLEIELSVTTREKAIAKRSIKLLKQTDTVFEKVLSHIELLELLREKINEARDENERLENIRQAELTRLQETEACISKLETEMEKATNELIIKKQKDQELKAKLRDLKQATNTYINVRALPKRVQGVVVSEKTNSTEWRPINIDATKVKRQELKNRIWQQSDNVSEEHKFAWERIIFGTSNDDNKEN